jgi:hypothetical protein
MLCSHCNDSDSVSLLLQFALGIVAWFLFQVSWNNFSLEEFSQSFGLRLDHNKKRRGWNAVGHGLEAAHPCQRDTSVISYTEHTPSVGLFSNC